VFYTPGRWALMMFVMRCMPRFMFNRLNL
jgi:hypothetical protein